MTQRPVSDYDGIPVIYADQIISVSANGATVKAILGVLETQVEMFPPKDSDKAKEVVKPTVMLIMDWPIAAQAAEKTLSLIEAHAKLKAKVAN